jgi:prepilin peptidase CpaA
MPGAVALAAALDLFTMRIPNRLSAVMVLAFLPLGLLAGLAPWELLNHVGAGLIGLLLGVLLFIPGWFGGGDAKLMAAIALWVGLDNLLPYVLYVALAGGFIASFFSLARSVPLPHFLLGQAWAHRLHNPMSGIPYGIALAAGALLVYPQTIWFESLTR